MLINKNAYIYLYSLCYRYNAAISKNLFHCTNCNIVYFLFNCTIGQDWKEEEKINFDSSVLYVCTYGGIDI